MRRLTTARSRTLSPDAYAGFLKLWLTPSYRLPEITPEIEAYLHHTNEREPLSPALQLAIGQLPKRAA